MSKFIVLGRSTKDQHVAGPLGIPFEIAPDSALRARFPQAPPLAELIGDFEEKKRDAYALARRLLENEPALRSLRQLGVFEEVVIRELLRGYHALHLHNRLLAEGVGECVFAEPSSLGSSLALLSRLLGSKLQVHSAGPPKRSAAAGLVRSLRRLGASGLAPSALRLEMHQLLERIDPFHRRHALRRRNREWRRHDVWFFTTAHTFTNIGLLYEPYFPEPLQFLVESPLTGGAPLQARGRSYVSLYDFADGDFVPAVSELKRAREAIEEHLTSVFLAGEEKALRDFFMQSPFFQIFLTRHLPYGLFSAQVFECWLDETRPSALVVGNPVFEGPALILARQRGIPTLLLQHGILGDFCQLVNPPTDHYIVRGTFWRDFLAPPMRRQAVILNPQEKTAAAREAFVAHRVIVFLTAPYGMQEFWSETDLDDILRALAAVAAAEGAPLVIRVHPLERVAEYRTRVKKLFGKVPAGVSFSQSTELRGVLSGAAAAVTYASTAFLDCLREGVPIVSFGWHHFSYKRQIESYGAFHFAQDLAHLRELVTRALRGSLPPYAETTEPFLAATGKDELKNGIAAAIERIDRRPSDVPAGLATVAN